MGAARNLGRNAGVVRATLRASLIMAAQYRVNYGMWMAVSVLQAVVYMTVWRAVADARGGSVSGYDAGAFAGYYVSLMVVRDLTTSWVLYDLPNRIQTGELSPMLLRPAHPLVDLWGRIAATRVQRIMLVVPVAVTLGLLYQATIAWNAQALLGVALVLPLAIATRYLIDALIGTVGFWMVRTDGLRGLYVMFVLMTSGQFVPIDVMPQAVQTLSKALPFYWTLGFPVELVVGRAEPADAAGGAIIVAAWGLVAWLALRASWSAGVRRYGAVGA